MKHSSRMALESAFDGLVRMFKMPEPTREHRFHPVRKWRFDFAWPDKRLAVEIDGLVPSGKGRHQTIGGMTKDLEKRNAAVLCGWRVLHYSQIDLRQRPAQVAEEVLEALGGGDG